MSDESNETPNQVDENAEEQSVEAGNFTSNREDVAASRTVASRQRVRDQLSDDVEAFLARGGKISQVDANVTADPPKRPESNYGQRPI